MSVFQPFCCPTPPDTNLLHNSQSGSDEPRSNNAISPPPAMLMTMNVAIEDFLKEHKTLNVNMNVVREEGQAAGDGSATLNNRINFDSEKFARHGYQDNTRPPATIENLNNREEKSATIVFIFIFWICKGFLTRA